MTTIGYDDLDDLDLTESFADALRSGASRIEQYVGVWAMHGPAFHALAGFVRLSDVPAHVAATRAQARPPEYSYAVWDRVAVLDIQGTITKRGDSFSGAPGSLEIKRQLRNASRDSGVDSIVLRIDSPGGTVSGTQELADEVVRAAKTKPVIAYIDDMGASAAYWIASQATRVLANQTAEIGSIGTYGVLYDYSSAYGMAGVKTHVMSTGAYKGAGVPGSEVTDSQRAELQRIVNELNEFFVRAVSRGRGIPLQSVRDLADGRVWLASDAKRSGLIDGVSTLEAAVSLARREARNQQTRGAGTMVAEDDVGVVAVDLIEALEEPSVDPAEQVQSAVPATERVASATARVASIAEIREACAGADADFVLGQVESGATVESAMRDWISVLSSRLDAAQSMARRPGVSLGGDVSPEPEAVADEEIDAVAQAEQFLRSRCDSGMIRGDALTALNRERPDLRAAYVAQYNARHNGRRRGGRDNG